MVLRLTLTFILRLVAEELPQVRVGLEVLG